MVTRNHSPVESVDMQECVIYARYSSHTQRDVSIEQQVADCEAYARLNNLRVVKVYADRHLSGMNDKRPQFQKMLKDAERGCWSYVLTWKVDRFARNRYDSATYKYRLKRYGVRVIYAKESIPDGPEGILLESVLEGSAEYYSANLSQNIKRGMRYNALECKVNNGSIPFGYCKGPDGRYAIVDAEAEVVREIFRKVSEGVPFVDIANALNGRGIRTKRGGLWGKGSFHALLKNEKYIGDALLQKTYTADFLSKKIRKNNGELEQVYVKNNHPAIISRGVFHQVQEELARRAGKRKVSQKRTKSEKGRYASKFALSELLVCGDCGAHYRRVTWARGGKKKIVWRCMSRLEFGTKYCRNSPTMDEDKLQEAVTRALARLTGDKADVASTVRNSVLAALGACNDGFDEAAALRRLDEAKRETLDLMDLSAKSHDEEHFAKKFQELRDEMASLQAAVEKHRKQRDNAEALGEQAQAVMDALESETFDWTEYNDTAVRHLVSKITVVRFDRIRIQFKNGMEVEECVL